MPAAKSNTFAQACPSPAGFRQKSVGQHRLERMLCIAHGETLAGVAARSDIYLGRAAWSLRYLGGERLASAIELAQGSRYSRDRA